MNPTRGTSAQCQDIRTCLKTAGRTEDEILHIYGVGKLEELSSILAGKVLRRLQEMRRSRS